MLAFLRSSPDAAPQLAIVPAEGGEPMVITAAKLGVREFAFSADGKRLAFIAPAPEEGRHGTLPDVGPAKEDPRHITSLHFQQNGLGYTADKRAHVFVVSVPDLFGEPTVVPVGRAADEAFEAVPAATRLSSGDFDHRAPVWDGDAVIAVSARHDARDRDLREGLYRFESPGAEPARLTDTASTVGVIGSPVLVGDEVFFVGGELGDTGLDFFGQNPGCSRSALRRDCSATHAGRVRPHRRRTGRRRRRRAGGEPRPCGPSDFVSTLLTSAVPAEPMAEA